MANDSPAASLRSPLLTPPVALSVLVLGALAAAASQTALPRALGHLAHWSPALTVGMLLNILVSVVAITLGTLLGLVVGALKLSPHWFLRWPAAFHVQLFRNAPKLVLIYFTSYLFPYEIVIGGKWYAFPDWIKLTIGLAMPASAYVAEIFRGAILSIPAAQWESARSLAFTRRQIFLHIILPQCARRMLPPWMNLYAVIAMSTSLGALVGVHELLGVAQIASATVNEVPFTVLIYLTVLAVFFAYCYPIAQFTRKLEKKLAYH